MSRWINKDLFNKFVNEKKSEKESSSDREYVKRSELTWKNPEKGTTEKAKVYVGRFLPDPDGNFYVKYFYHMFKVGEKWNFFLCPKTRGMEEFCPWCAAAAHLYTGTKADKEMAFNIKRKERFAANWYVMDDPRDADVANEDDKVTGKVRIYEFPTKLEKKIKEQITDGKNGLGDAIFDPGKEGFDFILKVTSTKKDSNGKEFPDYSLSEFGRKPHAIADIDKDIESIMKTTISLSKYLENMERDDEITMAVLKQSMLWDLVESEWKKAKGVMPTEKQAVKQEEEEDIPDFNKKEEAPFDSDDSDDSELSDSQLLKELENL